MDSIPLHTPEYTIEVWDINDVFIMDISDLIATSLRIQMSVNGPEDISFTLDLVQFEERCRSVGANPRSIIEPYRTDIKIRRNNEYLCGAQVVQVNVNFNQQETNKIEVKCTGYLNYFKDRYLTANYNDMTYAEIARKLIIDSQSQPNLILNSTFDEDVAGWVAIDSGYIAWDSEVGYSRKGSLYVSNTSGTKTYGGARYFTQLLPGVTYTINFRYKAATSSGTIRIVAFGTSENEISVTDTDWHLYTYTWTQPSLSSTLDIKSLGNMNFFIDEVSLVSSIDDPAYFNFGVTLGIDTASPVQQTDRQRTYDLQNVKDGIFNLTKLENDNFDFEFTANKVFNTYERLGSDKPGIELVYPQNITSISVSRDASTLANRIIGLGSGIGSERLQTAATGYESAASYRIRERTETFNSVSRQETLDENTVGKLYEYQYIYEVPEITVDANNLDLNKVKLGDAINVRVDNSSYVSNINGMYRILGININLDADYNESVSLDMEKW